MERHIASHLMVAEDGSTYEVNEFQDFILVGTHEDPHAKIAGLKRLALLNGKAVNFIDQNSFKIVSTGKIIRRA